MRAAHFGHVRNTVCSPRRSCDLQLGGPVDALALLTEEVSFTLFDQCERYGTEAAPAVGQVGDEARLVGRRVGPLAHDAVTLVTEECGAFVEKRLEVPGERVALHHELVSRAPGQVARGGARNVPHPYRLVGRLPRCGTATGPQAKETT